MCDAYNHTSYGLGLKDVTEVLKHVVYILGNINVIFHLWLYKIPFSHRYLMQP